MLLRCALIILLLGLTAANALSVAAQEARPRVAVLDFGATETGRRAADALSSALAAGSGVRVVERALSRDAARGAGYTNSLNMTLAEARDLGAAIDCDFFITGDAQTIRRSPSERPSYHEAYASVFVVSARTGKLLMWSRPREEAATPEVAEKSLLGKVRREASACRKAIESVQEDERQLLHKQGATQEESLVEDAPEEGTPDAEGYRPPAPYKRVQPPYTAGATEAEAEATIDVSVEIGADGSVGRMEVVRWAGFGLDEAVVSTVRRMRFRPAMRDGAPFPVRVLLRYNFRRPRKSN